MSTRRTPTKTTPKKPLPPDETKFTGTTEEAYKAWLKRQSKKLGRDLSMDEPSYDVRGLFRELKGRDIPPGHGPDTHKRRSHPTFSDESRYSSKETPGGRWGRDAKGDYFKATEFNVKSAGGPERLKQAFDDQERDLPPKKRPRLVLPGKKAKRG